MHPSHLAPYAARRTRLLADMGAGLAIIPTAPERPRNRDNYHPYRADSYFWYLTAFPEPEAVLVLAGPRHPGEAPQSILFCRDKDEEQEIWQGFRYGPEGARTAFGFDAAYSINELDARLPELMADRPTLWHSLGHDSVWDERIATALNGVRAQARAGKRAPEEIRDLRSRLDAMRRVKDHHEIAVMGKAAAIGSAGHLRAMRACRPGMMEYQLEAELSYEFRRLGADGHSFNPIVAGGRNACTLHYDSNHQALKDGDLVLIDAGCEVEGYASDITRTFPVNGRFTSMQKDVYEIVLASQAAAIAASRPGVPFMTPHEATVRVLTQGMVDLGLLQGSVDGLLENGDYKRFYMHRTGHWVGLDVHDAGPYKDGDSWTLLQPGMTVTVEPGLYLRPGPGVPEALAGIGIRIEDDILITADGCAVYTTAPKTVADIEAVMRHDA